MPANTATMTSPNSLSSDSEIGQFSLVQEVVIKKKKHKKGKDETREISFLSRITSLQIDNVESPRKRNDKNIKHRSHESFSDLKDIQSNEEQVSIKKRKKDKEREIYIALEKYATNVSMNMKKKTGDHKDDTDQISYFSDSKKHNKKNIEEEPEATFNYKILDINQRLLTDEKNEVNNSIDVEDEGDPTKKPKKSKHNKNKVVDNKNDYFNINLDHNKQKKKRKHCEERNDEKLNSYVNDETELERTSAKKMNDKRVLSLISETDVTVNDSSDHEELKRNSLFTDDLSITKKRKRDVFTNNSFTEEVLHKSKKVKLKPRKELESKVYTNEIRDKSESPTKKRKEETRNEEYQHNSSFEDRLSTIECLENTGQENIKPKNVLAADRDSPLDALFDKLIKNRKEAFDEENEQAQSESEQSIERVQKISTEIEESFRRRHKKSRSNKSETNCIENNEVDRMNTKYYDKSTKNKENDMESVEKAIRRRNEDNGQESDEYNEQNATASVSRKKKRKIDLSTEEMEVKIEDSDNYINGIKLSTLQLKALKGLVVKLPFKPHPVHMIETKLTNRPKPDQRQRIEALGFPLIIKCYNSWEDQIIRSNWSEFCERHILDEDPGPFLVPNIHFPHVERTKFVRYLARGLEHRTLASVYKRFRLLFSTHLKKGKFSAEEDRIIFDYIDKIELEGYTKKQVKIFAHLSTILKRDRLQIEKHYISICQESNPKLMNKDCDKLIKILLEVLEKENVEELKDCEITLSDWKIMETFMDYPYNQLKSFWRNTVYPKLFHEGDRDFFNIRKEITKMLLEEESIDWKSVNWQDIAKGFTGQTGSALYRMFKNLVCSQVPKPMWDNLEDCTKYLRDNYFNTKPTFRRSSVGLLKRISQDIDGIYKVHKDDGSL